MIEAFYYLFPTAQSFIIFLLLLFFVIIPFFRSIKNSSLTARAIAQNGLSVEGAEIPTEEFFTSIMEKLEARNTPGLKMYIEDVTEGGYLSPDRSYLVLNKDDVMYYVCTFPFGTSQAFTYWHVAPSRVTKNIILNIPYFGKIISAMFFPVTLYKMDVAAVLNGILKHDIAKTIKEIGNVEEHGLRELAEVDFQRLRELS